MELTQARPVSASPLERKLEEQRAAALDQIEAAWQLYVARVEEALAEGWKNHLERAVQERFQEIAVALGETFAQQLEERLAELRRTLRAELAAWFNQSLRRLQHSEGEDELYGILLELAGTFADQAVLMLIEGDRLRCAGARDFQAGSTEGVEEAVLRLSEATALASAAATREMTIAQNTADEVSEPLSKFFQGGSGDGRVGLFPVVKGQQSVAVLCASRREGEADAGGLELLAMMSGLVLGALEKQSTAALVQISTGQREKPAPEWSELSRTDAELHAAARRFARVQVAEMRLFRAQAVREGRAKHDLYSGLKQEIDSARKAFRASYINLCPTMVDYLHLELVRTLANDDARLLGPEYPGPMV